MITTVIPSRTSEYLEHGLQAMERHEPGSSESVVVADNGVSTDTWERWSHVRRVAVPHPFCFSQAINTAVRTAPEGHDLLILNDDTEIQTPLWYTRASRVLRALGQGSRFGLLSCRITGGVGNPEQAQVGDFPVIPVRRGVAFVALLIRRAAWEDIGEMDERFVGYGCDDNDYCHRARLKGWLIGMIPALVVHHGQVGYPSSSSYWRYGGQVQWHAAYQQNRQLYIEKWGVAPEDDQQIYEQEER